MFVGADGSTQQSAPQVPNGTFASFDACMTGVLRGVRLPPPQQLDVPTANLILGFDFR
jgi:hypothetical protein